MEYKECEVNVEITKDTDPITAMQFIHRDICKLDNTVHEIKDEIKEVRKNQFGFKQIVVGFSILFALICGSYAYTRLSNVELRHAHAEVTHKVDHHIEITETLPHHQVVPKQ